MEDLMTGRLDDEETRRLDEQFTFLINFKLYKLYKLLNSYTPQLLNSSTLNPLTL